MNIRLAILFWALCLCMCSPPPKPPLKPSTPGQDYSLVARPRVNELSTEMEKAVLSHDTAAILNMLDPDYKAKELIKFHNGIPGPFLDSFFCGRVLGIDQFFCLDFKDISAIKNTGMEINDATARVQYIVKSSAHEIETRLQVTLQKGEPIGWIGSRGFTQVE